MHNLMQTKACCFFVRSIHQVRLLTCCSNSSATNIKQQLLQTCKNEYLPCRRNDLARLCTFLIFDRMHGLSPLNAIGKQLRGLISSRLTARVWRMSELTRGVMAEPVSRDQTLRPKWGQGKHHFCYSADLDHNWTPCLVDSDSADGTDHTYTYLRS